MVRKVKEKFLQVVDLVLSPVIIIASGLLWFVRRVGIQHMPLARLIFQRIGVFPIRDHYYEPLFNSNQLKRHLDVERNLPALDMCQELQLQVLSGMNYRNELIGFPREPSRNEPPEFYYDNPSFAPGDSDYLYSVIRKFKPRKIIEIGSGMSTLMALRAVEKNIAEDEDYKCRHVCIEPYEAAWLSRVGVELKKKVVESVPLEEFACLRENDLLFIDSSHMIRPQGDVLYEYLEILPSLQRGVIVHIHDIFTPRDYLDQWVRRDVRFWNEQYLLEAFLSFNREFEILGALNWLRHHHFGLLKSRCAFLNESHEPGSIYLRRK